MQARRKEDGAVLVEFALVLPILLVLLLGIVQFGLAFNYWIDETHLTREAVRYAAVDVNPGPEATLQESIRQQADTQGLRSDSTVSICFLPGPGGTSGQVGDPVRARMSVPFALIPFLDERISGTIATISVTATMRLEAVATNYAADADCAV